jgi:hypothetical protein
MSSVLSIRGSVFVEFGRVPGMLDVGGACDTLLETAARRVLSCVTIYLIGFGRMYHHRCWVLLRIRGCQQMHLRWIRCWVSQDGRWMVGRCCRAWFGWCFVRWFRRSMGSLMQKREERGEVCAHKSEVSTYSETVQRPFK